MVRRILGIDALRAIGALMIVIGHFSTAFIPSEFDVPTYVTAIQNSFGFAVQLFFIIAGFTLSYRYYNRLNNKSELKNYYIIRFFRIAPVFYVMIVIWGCFYYFQMGVSFSPVEYLANFTFSFNFFPAMIDSIVAAGWFIGVLFLFYLIFPILIRIIRTAKVAIPIIIGVLVLSSYFFLYEASRPELYNYGYKSVLTQFPFFLIGIGCFLLMRNVMFKEGFFEKISTKIIGGVLIGTSLFIFYLFSWDSPLNSFLFQKSYILVIIYIGGLIYGLLLGGVIMYPWKGIVNRVSKFIADRSYSIYLLHLFLIQISLGLYTAIFYNINNFNLAYFVSILIILAIVIPISSIIYRFIEQPAYKYGKSLLLKKESGEIPSQNT